MRYRLLAVGLIGITATMLGCTQTVGGPAGQMDYNSVAVRFVMPPEYVPATNNWDDSDAQLTSSPANTPNGMGQEQDWVPGSSPQHVVMWGGHFDGADVTHSHTSLEPGPYMFRYFDVDGGSAYEGWLNVNNCDDTLDTLRAWHQGVNDQKEWLGYNAKISGKFETGDVEDFEHYRKQLSTLGKLEHRLKHAMKAEARANAHQRRQFKHLFELADILLLPGGGSGLYPTTRPTFTKTDLVSARNGQAITKMVLVADYEKTVEKLGRVNELRSDLINYRSVLNEEVKYLKRNKRFLTVTDHLYHHGTKFIENEQRLQMSYAEFNKVNSQIAKCRQQSIGLAFTAELIDPNGSFRALEEVEQELKREAVVLKSMQEHIDALHANAEPNSSMRVGFEADRQQIAAAFKDNDDQIAGIGEARSTLQTLTNATDVIYRHGHARVLTATLVGDNIPARMANALESESMMTVRLHHVDSPEMPVGTSVTESLRTKTIHTSWGDN